MFHLNYNKDNNYSFNQCAALLKSQDLKNLTSWNELLLLSTLNGAELDDEFVQLFILSFTFTNKYIDIFYNGIIENCIDNYIQKPWFIILLYNALLWNCTKNITKCIPYNEINLKELQKKSFNYWYPFLEKNDLLNFNIINKNKLENFKKIMKVLFIKYSKYFLLFYKTNENKILHTNIALTYNLINWLEQMVKINPIYNNILKNIKLSYNTYESKSKFIQ